MAEGATELLSGWGRTAPTAAHVVTPTDPAALDDLLAHPGRRGVVARGLGRSYGDAAQNAGGTVVDTRSLDAILAVDVERATVTVDGGVRLDPLARELLARGLFPAGAPGTRQVAIGGALAADVHGNSHHFDGS